MGEFVCGRVCLWARSQQFDDKGGSNHRCNKISKLTFRALTVRENLLFLKVIRPASTYLIQNFRGSLAQPHGTAVFL